MRQRPRLRRASRLFGCAVLCLACERDDLPLPVPNAVDPPVIDANDGLRLTVTGTGFMSPPIRRLSRGETFEADPAFQLLAYRTMSNRNRLEIPLTDVEHIDARTIIGRLPADVPDGTYGVRVTAPNGKHGERDDLFTVSAAAVVETDPPLFGETDFDPEEADFVCRQTDDCEGSCSGDTCSFACLSSGRCDYRCDAGTCDMICAGAGSCGMDCAANHCELFCRGTGDCHMDCATNTCMAVNSGSGALRVDCQAGTCDVSCQDTSPCIIFCDSGDCTIECDAQVRQCDSKTYACNASCPEG